MPDKNRHPCGGFRNERFRQSHFLVQTLGKKWVLKVFGRDLIVPQFLDFLFTLVPSCPAYLAQPYHIILPIIIYCP